MDRLILREKLDSLARCLQRVEDKTPATAAALAADPDLQDIVVLNLSRAVQLCVDIGSHLLSESSQPPPGTMGEVFSALGRLGAIRGDTVERMRKAVGFRNIAVHNYERIDWDVVHAIATRFIGDFRHFAADIAAHAGP